MTDTRYAAKLPTADSRHCPEGQSTAVPPPAGGSNPVTWQFCPISHHCPGGKCTAVPPPAEGGNAVEIRERKTSRLFPAGKGNAVEPPLGRSTASEVQGHAQTPSGGVNETCVLGTGTHCPVPVGPDNRTPDPSHDQPVEGLPQFGYPDPRENRPGGPSGVRISGPEFQPLGTSPETRLRGRITG